MTDSLALDPDCQTLYCGHVDSDDVVQASSHRLLLCPLTSTSSEDAFSGEQLPCRVALAAPEAFPARVCSVLHCRISCQPTAGLLFSLLYHGPHRFVWMTATCRLRE